MVAILTMENIYHFCFLENEHYLIFLQHRFFALLNPDTLDFWVFHSSQ